MTFSSLSRSSLLCLCLCMLLMSCASLPDADFRKVSLNTGDTATVTTARGTLSDQASESLVAQRLRGTRTDLAALAALEEKATGSPLVAGNRVTILFDGPETMHAMLEAIRGARDHVNLETYIFDQDEFGAQFADLLIEKQRAGVQVNIIYDSIGTLGTPAEFFTRMRDAGIKLTEFNPVNPLKRFVPWRLNNRDHRKILVVDGRIAFTGGINIARDYSHSSRARARNRANKEKRKEGDTDTREEGGWRDTHIRIEGPAVAGFQLLFLDTWVKQSAAELADRDYFPRLNEVGKDLVRVIASEPGSDHEIYKTYLLALQQAQKSIHLTMAYFSPDARVIEALTGAARRGVDVVLLFPSITDSGLIFHAGRSFYSELMAAGVKIHEFQPSVLHAKTAVVDGAWSTVGSANLDWRSFLHNSEVNAVILGNDFGNRMENLFQGDLKNSVRITPEEWERRSIFKRFKENFARLFEYWL